MIKINFMLKKLVAGLYVDRISFVPLNEYLKIGTFFLNILHNVISVYRIIKIIKIGES